jgi:hypothetical protein
VNLLVQPDGKVLVDLTRLNQDGSVDQTFNPQIPFPFPAVVLLDGPKLLVADRQTIYRLNADGSLDKAFPFRLRMNYLPPSIHGMALQNGKLRIVGDFYEVNGLPRFGATRLLLDEAPATGAVIAPDSNYNHLAPYWNEGYPGMGQAQITIRRLGDTLGPATVHYQTQDGSAIAGRDYTAVSGDLTFGPFEVEKSFALPILDHGGFEPDKMLQLLLSPGPGVDSIGPPTTFIIHGNEVKIQSLQFDGSHLDLQFNAVPGGNYILEGSADLVNWAPLESYQAFDYAGFFGEDASTVSQQFFRIKIGN